MPLQPHIQQKQKNDVGSSGQSHPISLMQSLANGSWPNDYFEVLAVMAFNWPRARKATDETRQTLARSDSVLLRQLSFGLALAGLYYAIANAPGFLEICRYYETWQFDS